METYNMSTSLCLFLLSVISDKQVKGGLLLLNKWMMGDVVAKRYSQIENLGG